MIVLNRYLVFIFLFLYEKVAVTTGEVIADSRLLDGTDTFGNETMILRIEESEIIANAERDDDNTVDISTRNHSVKKGSKKQEYSSSSSLSRNSKKGNKKGSNKGPTPSPAFVITNSPTSQFSFAVTISPYALYYKFENDARRTDEDNTPLDDTGVDHMSTSISSVDEIAQLTEITRRFLEQYARGYYSQTSIITLDDFLTTLKDGETENLPVSAVFDSVALFNPASIFYPPRSQIEQLVEDAFTESLSVQSYIKMLQEELPSQNRFSTVVEVSYGGTEYMGYS